MKLPPIHLPTVLLALALPAHGAQFHEVLATLEAGSFTGGTDDFVAHVTWIDNPAPAHYTCRESEGSQSLLELWRGSASGARDRFGEQSLRYGENGSVSVFSVTDDNNKPLMAAYFMLPGGDTWLFRLDASSRGVTKDGKRFQCEVQGKAGSTTGK